MNLEYGVTSNGDDNPKERFLDIGDNKIFFRFTDPYGFVALSIEKGQLPTALKTASYTSLDQALTAVKNYLNSKKKE